MYDVLTIEDWIRRVYMSARGANDPRRIAIEAFGYPYVITSLAAVGGTNSGTLAINGNADFEEAGDADVIRKVRADLDAKGKRDVTDQQIAAKLDELMHAAIADVKAGK